MIPTPEELAAKYANPKRRTKYAHQVRDDSGGQIEILELELEEAQDLAEQLPDGWTIERLK